MKLVSTEKDYNSMAISIESILDETKLLPENVFRPNFRYFLFITFDELFMPLFFENIKRYIVEVNEKNFWLTAINPDPKLYFGFNFDFFGAIEFSSSDTEDNFLSALNDYPEDSPADALAHNSNLLMVFSSSNRWAIYGDRDADIAICAFSDRELMELFKLTYGSDLLGGLKSAAEHAYGAAGNDELLAKFCDNYIAA